LTKWLNHLVKMDNPVYLTVNAIRTKKILKMNS
jgi:hypothetical protein